MIVLSYVQIKPLLKARGKADRLTLSPDLGLTTVEVMLDESGVRFPNGERLAWANAEKIAESDNACFALEGGEISKIQQFSETTRRHCSLMPTQGAPTLLIAGFPMHRIKDTDPYQDTVSKIKAARPMGQVLDTSMGLGYTAIQAAHSANHVITLELDPAVLEVAQQNPWSQELFSSPKIERRIADSYEEVETFDDEAFSCIIHDPPTIQLAGELYSGEFYRRLYRILKPRGRLFHYIGDLRSASVKRIVRGVTERLSEAGFQNIQRHPEAFGVTATK
ncbi:MAG TPA: methyltransferase domain-containing protein [Phototrophicaceae bacterium]|nr:methyltransferase domain-containing protein [Phototrophicaceae bacterium]